MAESATKTLRLIVDEGVSQQWKDILAFYTERNGSDHYSTNLNEKLQKKLEFLCHSPKMGQKTKRKGIRRQIVAGRFAVFYRIKKDAIEVVAIVDARRNVPLD